MVSAAIPHGPDQPGVSLGRKGKDCQEIGFVEIDMQLAIDGRTGCVDVGNIEDLPIGPAGESGADNRSDLRSCSVASGKVPGSASKFGLIGSANETRRDVIALIDEVDQRRLP